MSKLLFNLAMKKINESDNCAIISVNGIHYENIEVISVARSTPGIACAYDSDRDMEIFFDIESLTSFEVTADEPESD